MPFPALEVIRKVAGEPLPELPDGSPNIAMGIRPIKEFVKPYWLASEPDVSVSLGAGVKARLQYAIDSQGHFDWAALMGTFSNGPVMLYLFDANSNRFLSNKPVHSTTICGSGQRYFRLPCPYFFNVGDSQREFQIFAENAVPGVGTTVVSIVPFGRRFYHKEMPPQMAAEILRDYDCIMKEYPYLLVPEDYDFRGVPPVLAANAKTQFEFEMDDSADLECSKLLFASTGAFTFTLREKDKDRLLMADLVHSSEGWGNAEFPVYLMDSFLLQRKRQLIMEITDLSGAPNYIFATIAGIRSQYR